MRRNNNWEDVKKVDNNNWEDVKKVYAIMVWKTFQQESLNFNKRKIYLY